MRMEPACTRVIRGENAADREIWNRGEKVDRSGAFITFLEGKKLPAIEVLKTRAVTWGSCHIRQYEWAATPSGALRYEKKSMEFGGPTVV